MNYNTQLTAELKRSLEARDDVDVLTEPPPPPDLPAAWFDPFAIETNASLLGTFQEGKPPFELELNRLLTDMRQQLLRKKVKPQNTCAATPRVLPYVTLVAHFRSEGYVFALYIASISAVEEANPGAAVARIGLALNVDSQLL